MGILSGFNEFGFGSDDIDIFQKAVTPEEIKEEKRVKSPEEIELELLFDKSYTCPICENKFTSKKVRTGKVKLLGSEIDLRPKYEQMDTLKYDTVVCHKCGYAALTRFFEHITLPQERLIKEKITATYKDKPEPEGIYTYDDALDMHKLALLNAVVKRSRANEKAYICLKMAWLCRGKAESLPEDTPDREAVIAQCKKDEMDLLTKACQGFIAAVESEPFPMCGMDESTVDYLIAALEMEIGEYDKCAKLLSNILVSRNANSRMKDRARFLRDELQKRKKNS